MPPRPSYGQVTITGCDDTIQRKRQKKNPMTISSLLSDPKDTSDHYLQLQRPINASSLNAVEPVSTIQSPRGRYMRGMTTIASHRSDIAQARDVRESRMAKVLPRNEMNRDRCSELHSNGGEALHDKWGDRIADWVDEDALYANVATSGPSEGEDDQITRPIRHLSIDYDLNARAHEVPNAYPYPGERYSKEDFCPLSPLPYMRSPSQPHTARSASVVSIRSYVSGVSVPPSPFEENGSSASEASHSRRGSVQDWASGYSPCITPSIIGREREISMSSTNFIPSNRHYAGVGYTESKRSAREDQTSDTEAYAVDRGRTDSLSSNEGVKPTSYTYPPVAPAISAEHLPKGSQLPDLPSPSSNGSAPYTLTGKKRSRKRPSSPRPTSSYSAQGGDAEYECRMGECGVRLKPDDTKNHILDCHWAEFKIRDPDGVCRKILCGWPGCAYGSAEKGGITLSVYARHVVSVHVENPGEFICPKCKQKSYARRDAMVRHMKNSCLKCKKCHAKIQPVEAYEEHLTQIERGWDCRFGIPPIGDAGYSRPTTTGTWSQSAKTKEARDYALVKEKEAEQVKATVRVKESVNTVYEEDEGEVDDYDSEEGEYGECEYESEEGEVREGVNLDHFYKDEELEDGELGEV